MTRLRAILFAMLLVQVVHTALLTDTLLFPVFAAVIAVAAFLRPLSLQFSLRQKTYLFLGLAVFFGLKMRLFPLDIQGRFSPFLGTYEFSHAFAQWLFVIQVLLLAMHRFDKYEPNVLGNVRFDIPLLGAMQLALIGDFIGHSMRYRNASLASAALFTLLLGAYIYAATTTMRQKRHSLLRTVVSLLLVIAAVIVGGTFSQVASPAVSKLDILLFQLFRPQIQPQGTGFSQQSTLRSISAMRDSNAERVALRVRSETAPEYLRAYGRDRFDGRTWASADEWVPVQAITTENNDFPPMKRYALRTCEVDDKHNYAVWHAAAQTDILFTTLDTACTSAVASLIEVNEHLACRVEQMTKSHPYLLKTGASSTRETLEDSLRQRCLIVPDSLTPEAREVCRAVLDGATTAGEAIQRTAHFFKHNYTYRLGITVPPEQDPLSYFLTERPAAHCEYFASAAVIMLRTGGVPARYVTGFVVTEKNTAGGYWVARNRDAHAWAEAWDDARGWVTVEATPPDGLPTHTQAGTLASIRDMLQFRLGTWWAQLREQAVLTIASFFSKIVDWITGSWSGRLSAFIFLLLATAYSVKNHRPRRRKTSRVPEEIAWERLLSRMDADARHRGFIRLSPETLHQFATRISAADNAGVWHNTAACWYRTCATLRCSGTPLHKTTDTLERLLQTEGK